MAVARGPALDPASSWGIPGRSRTRPSGANAESQACPAGSPVRLLGALETHLLAGEGWEKYPEIQDVHFIYLKRVCDLSAHWWQRLGTGKPTCQRWRWGGDFLARSFRLARGDPALEGVGEGGKQERLPAPWNREDGAHVSRPPVSSPASSA